MSAVRFRPSPPSVKAAITKVVAAFLLSQIPNHPAHGIESELALSDAFLFSSDKEASFFFSLVVIQEKDLLLYLRYFITAWDAFLMCAT